MNSYNENLHTSVVTSLNAQELELQKLKSQVDAATFSMYYAQGARITAAEKLELTTDKYKFQQKVNDQAVVDSDLSTNVLTSANNVKAYVAKSVTNTSVAASNVQIAANAVLKLASDTGSIFSIVNAADFETEIYLQSKMAYDLMNETAYLAEKASQHSMEASSLIAEVSSTSLADKATETDSSVKSLLAVVTTELDDSTAELSTETAKLALANTDEKKTEGDLEEVNATYNAAQEAYELSKKELNLNLSIKTPQFIGDRTRYTVSFDRYKSPFPNLFSNTDSGYPVENYYIMLVKNSNKATFSISEAEGLVTQGKTKQYVVVPSVELDDENTTEKKTTVLKPIKKTIFISDLLDSDGDKMGLGKDYVVFIYTALKTGYKKIINTFDNLLSASSSSFNLTNQLNAPLSTTILVGSNNPSSAQSNGNEDSLKTDQPVVISPLNFSQKLSFNVWENPDYAVEYRCMFLPHNLSLITGLLTVEGLASIETEAEGLEKIADKYEPQISETNLNINTNNSELTSVNERIVVLEEKLKNTPSKTDEKKLEGLKENKKSLAAKLNLLRKELETLTTAETNAIKDLESVKQHQKPGFYFDLLTAQKVPAGSYMVPKKANITKLSNKDELSKYFEALLENLIADINPRLRKQIENDVAKLKADIKKVDKEKFGTNEYIRTVKIIIVDVEKLELALKKVDFSELIEFLNKLLTKYEHYEISLTLAPETTDNYGNRLINKNYYIPVILAISNAKSVEENQQFSNIISDFQTTTTFQFNATEEKIAY